MNSNISDTQRIVLIGVLSSIATVLMYLEIPINIISFLRIDLSDVVVLIAFSMLGVRAGITVGFVKSFVHFMFPGSNPTYGIGEAAAFIASITYIGGFYISTIKFKLNKVYSAIFTIAFMSFILTFLNCIIIAPLYYMVLSNADYPNLFNTTYINSITTVYLPFNLIKGTVIFTVFLTIDKILQNQEIYNKI